MAAIVLHSCRLLSFLTYRHNTYTTRKTAYVQNSSYAFISYIGGLCYIKRNKTRTSQLGACLKVTNTASQTSMLLRVQHFLTHSPFLGYQGRVARLDAYSATVKRLWPQEYSRPEPNWATVSNFWLQEYSGPGGYRSQGTGFLLQEYSRPGALR